MAQSLMRNSSNATGGATLLSFGLFLFAIQDVIIKWLSDGYAVLQIVFIRSIVAMLILIVVLRWFYQPDRRRLKRFWPIGVKASAAFLSYTSYYMAMSQLPIADVAAIAFSAPIMVTALSVVLFREQVGIRRWLAVLTGFVAVVIVVGPKGHFGNIAVVLAFAAAFTYAISTITTRYMHPEDDALTAAFYSISVFLVWSIVASLLLLLLDLDYDTAPGAVQFLVRDWSMPGPAHLAMLMSLGLIAIGGFYSLIRAYMISEFSAVAPFEYTYILWGVLFGYLVWGDIPTPQTFTGIALLARVDSRSGATGDVTSSGSDELRGLGAMHVARSAKYT